MVITMQYEIKGTPLPVLIMNLTAGEQIKTEQGAMSWMSPNMEMSTNAGGGIGKAFGRMFSGESMFQNVIPVGAGTGFSPALQASRGRFCPFRSAPIIPSRRRNRRFSPVRAASK